MKLRRGRLKQYYNKIISDLRALEMIKAHIVSHTGMEPIAGYSWVWDKEDQRYYMQKGVI